MGSTFLGDIVSGALPSANITHASAATDGGAASVSAIGVNVQRAAQNITIVSACWEPTGADQPVAATASYRIYSLVDGSTDGTGTRVLASVNSSASQASNTTKALTLISAPTVSKGNVIYGAYSATTGGTHAGTLVRAGHFAFTWRPI